MAAVSLSDCTIRNQQEGEVAVAYIVSPSTMDSADTIDVSSILQGRTIVGVSAWDTDGEDSVTATSSSSVITVDAAGGTTDHTYVVEVKMLAL